jgi:predicted phage terminase large subunit-like protein
MRETILLNPFIPHDPWPKQALFLLLPHGEAFYGGAGGGGKSDALLMGALQYVEYPSYSAILFRKTFADLSLRGALLDRAHDWLGPTGARWVDQKKTWAFPSGATVAFGYLEHEQDKYRYASANFHYIGFDELTQFSESSYRFLFSRRRRLLEDTYIPLRSRSASNPGGVGHVWVKQRFITEGELLGRPFIPAKLDDNPSIDRQSYIESLNELDPITRAQILNGDWTAGHTGGKFRREWFEIVDSYPAKGQKVRMWDLGATPSPTENKRGKDPDWTAGCLLVEQDGQYWIADIKRMRGTPKQVEDYIRQTASVDGSRIPVHIEQEPGASGVSMIDHYQRRVLRGFSCYPFMSQKSKIERANPASSAAEAGNVFLVSGPWINAFLDEVEIFPNGDHDDQVDSFSGAFQMVSGHGEIEVDSIPRDSGDKFRDFAGVSGGGLNATGGFMNG